MLISFTVLGLPKPAGSKRSFPFRRGDGSLGVRVTDANPNSKDWKNVVASEARLHCGDGGLLTGPLRVEFTFIMPRPKGHFGAKGIKPSAPAYPTTRPDVLKLSRACEDALTGVLWRDDAQIVDETLRKFYGEPARVQVKIETHWTSEGNNEKA